MDEDDEETTIIIRCILSQHKCYVLIANQVHKQYEVVMVVE